MNEYINVGRKILKTLNNNGYEAYFIGESVRNYILKKNILKVDIATNANLMAFKKIFMEYVFEDIDETTSILDYEDYRFYIHAHDHMLMSIDKINASSKHYSKYLMEYVPTKDFTINAIAMSHSGKIIDVYNGYIDITKRRIRHIGKAKTRFKNNPELMVKAISLISELNYKLSNRTRREINKRRKYLLPCDVDNYINELKNIFEGPNAKKAIAMFNKTNLDTVLPTFKKVVRLLDSNYKQVSFQDVLLLAFLLNGKIEKQYQKYIVDYPRFVKIYNVAMQNKKSDYDEITLFTYGLEICLEANRYNQILKRSSNRQRKITKKWKTLKIKSTDDLVFNKIDIKRIIHPKDYYVIDEILVDAAVAVIAGEIKNTVTDVQSIVINLLNQNGISYSFNGIHELEELETKEKEVEQVKQSDLDIINKHLMRHQHINFEDQGKTNKKQNADELTSISLDYIKDNKDIQNKIKDNKNFESKLQEFILDYLESENKGDE